MEKKVIIELTVEVENPDNRSVEEGIIGALSEAGGRSAGLWPDAQLDRNERLNETNQAPNQELSKPVVKLPP